MEKALVVWRRFGKEHGEYSDFHVNPPAVIEAHIRAKEAWGYAKDRHTTKA